MSESLVLTGKRQRRPPQRAVSPPPPPPRAARAAPAAAAQAGVDQAEQERALLLQTKLALLESRLRKVKEGKVAAPLARPPAPAGAAVPRHAGVGYAPAPAAVRAALPPAKRARTNGSSGGGGTKKSRAAASEQPASPALAPAPPAALVRHTSRSNRAVRAPKMLAEDQSGNVKLAKPFRDCLQVLQRLMRHSYAGPFNTPVDHVALGIPHYPSVVAHPMDLGTVRTRLACGQYTDVDQFEDDCELVFANAMVFNEPFHDVYLMALALKRRFNDDMRRVSRVIPPPRAKQRKPAAESGGGSGARKRGGGGGGGGGEDDVEWLKEQVRELSRRVDGGGGGGGRKGGGGGGGGVAAYNKQPLTYREKQQLKDDIFKLPPNRLGRVVEIIRESMPGTAAQDGEIEIDIDAMDTLTLRKLQRYVRTSLQAANKAASKRRAAERKRAAAAAGGGAGGGGGGASSKHQQRRPAASLSGMPRPLAPLGGDASSSSSESESSESESSDDEDVPMNSNGLSSSAAPPLASSPSRGGGAPPAFGDPDSGLFSSAPAPAARPSAAAPIIGAGGSAPDVAVDSSAWSSMSAGASGASPSGAASNGGGGGGGDRLWSNFQNKSQEAKEREASRRAEEERGRAERVAREEELRRRGEAQRREQEAEQARQRAEMDRAEAEKQAKLEAEKEAARKEREQQYGSVNLDQERDGVSSINTGGLSGLFGDKQP